MTIRLTIRKAIWRSHVAQVVNAVAESGGGLVPVVKGNGYGFGRDWLADIASEFADTVAVGTIHELDGLPESVTAVVLTPTLTLPDDISPQTILTVGNADHIAAISNQQSDWGGCVIIKLVSSMQRFGGHTELIDIASAAGLDVVGVSIHPPLAGSADEHLAAIRSHLDDVDSALPVWVSHLDPADYGQLPATHQYRLRLGTLLWHGDKTALHLGADVLDVRPVRAGATAGYRMGTVEADGHLVMIGAGTANGVTMLDEGNRSLSPFHFERRRLALHEPPHMHTSMAFVPAGEPLPSIGDEVDLQRPLHMTLVDEYRWL